MAPDARAIARRIARIERRRPRAHVDLAAAPDEPPAAPDEPPAAPGATAAR